MVCGCPYVSVGALQSRFIDPGHKKIGPLLINSVEVRCNIRRGGALILMDGWCRQS